MISSYHRVLFVHIPKCAGQSVELSFLKDIHPSLNWGKHRHLLTCFKKPNDQCWNRLVPSRLAHLKASEYYELNVITKAYFDSLFKFAIVRDPCQRTLSAFKHLNRNRDVGDADLEDFSTRSLPRLKDSQFFFASQKAYLADRAGSLLVDRLVRFSALDEEFDAIGRDLGLSGLSLHKRNVSPASKLGLTARAEEAIREVYAEDYEFFANGF